MSKQAFRFHREHFIDDTRHPAGSEAEIDASIIAQLERAGVGKPVKPATTVRTSSGKGKSGTKD